MGPRRVDVTGAGFACTKQKTHDLARLANGGARYDLILESQYFNLARRYNTFPLRTGEEHG